MTLLPDHQNNAENQGRRIADRLGGKNSVDSPRHGKNTDKGNQKQNLPQERDNNGRNGLCNGLDALTDSAGRHNDESHNAGYYSVYADGIVSAVNTQLAVVNQAD